MIGAGVASELGAEAAQEIFQVYDALSKARRFSLGGNLKAGNLAPEDYLSMIDFIAVAGCGNE